MKRLLRTLLLTLVFAACMGVSVFAADEKGLYGGNPADTIPAGGTVSFQYLPETGTTESTAQKQKDGATDYYQGSVRLGVTYTNIDKVGADQQYLILVTNEAIESAADITDSKIEYIDQVASTAGQVDFTVYQKSLKNGGTYHIYLASSDVTTGALTSRTEIATYGYYAAYVLGDVDGNESVDTNDATWILQYYVNPDGNLSFNADAGDVDDNKSIDTNDATWVLQRYVGSRDEEYKPIKN